MWVFEGGVVVGLLLILGMGEVLGGFDLRSGLVDWSRDWRGNWKRG